MTRELHPALGLFASPENGWFGILHRQYPINGFFSYKENAEFYIKFDKGIGHSPSYEKWTFKKYSFIDNMQTQFPPQIEVEENDIIKKEKLSEYDYKIQPRYTGIHKP